MIRIGDAKTSVNDAMLTVVCDWPLSADVSITGKNSNGDIILTVDFHDYNNAIAFATDILNAAKECKRRISEYDEYMKTQTGIDGMNRAEAHD
jgi:hypothetical protein